MKRRLTTIFYADGVGWTSLMESDEAAAMAGLKRARGVMAELFELRDGRQVNTWGDAVIAEFPSVVEAVRCAVEVQEALGRSEAGLAADEELAPDKRLRFRIGVTLGDVMVEGEDIYGDGVNTAARLCELAPPGGVAVSGQVHELARKSLALGFDFAGHQRAHGIADRFPVWNVRVGGRNAPPEVEEARPGRFAPTPERVDRARGLFAEMAERADRWLAWLRDQPRAVQRSAGFILFFFMINLLFSGIATPWFVFPSLPFAIHIWRHARRGRAP